MTKKQKKMLIRICIAIVLLLIAKFVPMPGVVRIVLFAVTYLVIGYDILKKAAKGIGNGRVFDENFLMAIATLGAIALAVYKKDTDLTEAVAVMLFYQIGELFQSYAVGKSRRNITALMDIRPDYANIETDGKLEQVDPDEVTVGSTIVVQPGVEFDHTQIIHYQPQEAKALSAWIESTPMVYEAHSTDYQTRQAYRALVRDHFAILKVGPALTFALREAIFALAQMENELIAPESRSRVMEVIDEVMLNEPGYWKKYYRPTWSQAMVDIHFSLSDRIRYYWPHPRIRQSVEKLIANLTDAKLPLGLISQYMPVQFERLSLNELNAEPHALILDKIQDVLRAYRYGCSSETA